MLYNCRFEDTILDKIRENSFIEESPIFEFK